MRDKRYDQYFGMSLPFGVLGGFWAACIFLHFCLPTPPVWYSFAMLLTGLLLVFPVGFFFTFVLAAWLFVKIDERIN